MTFQNELEAQNRLLNNPELLSDFELREILAYLPRLSDRERQLFVAHLGIRTIRALDENRVSIDKSTIAIEKFDQSSRRLTGGLIALTIFLVGLTGVLTYLTIILVVKA